MRVRPIIDGEAGPYLSLCKKLDQEASYMLYEPGERATTLDDQQRFLRSVLQARNRMIFVAESEARTLVGHLQAMGGDLRRNQYTIYVVVGVLQEAAGQGVGTALLHALQDWAAEIGAHRLELTVMTHNERAVSLYRKMGFEIEGTARDTLYVDGRYVDEYLMAKRL